jgi:hypothetical protein
MKVPVKVKVPFLEAWDGIEHDLPALRQIGEGDKAAAVVLTTGPGLLANAKQDIHTTCLAPTPMDRIFKLLTLH